MWKTNTVKYKDDKISEVKDPTETFKISKNEERTEPAD